jgi:hypothetical protein
MSWGCSVYIRQNYYVQTLGVDVFSSQDTPQLTANGIVDDVLSKLNDMIMFNDFQSEDLPYGSQTVCEDPPVTANGSSGGLLDICADERAEADKNYSTLSREEKLNRLFIVLEVIVDLLEIDLCVFLVKHSFQVRKALSHQSYRPLIVSVLWRTNMLKGIGHLNGICRHIVALYAKCFVHNMNFNKWNVIAVSIIDCQHHTVSSRYVFGLWYSSSQHSVIRHCTCLPRGHVVAWWLRHCATNRKVAGSIPDEVNFLNLPNPSGRTRPWSLLSL